MLQDNKLKEKLIAYWTKTEKISDLEYDTIDTVISDLTVEKEMFEMDHNNYKPNDFEKGVLKCIKDNRLPVYNSDQFSSYQDENDIVYFEKHDKEFGLITNDDLKALCYENGIL